MTKARLSLADGSAATTESMVMDAEKVGKPNKQRTYWELEVPEDRNVGILLEPQGSGGLYYDGATGDVLDTNKKTVASCAPILAGSTVGINIWSMKKDSNYQNFTTFYTQGKLVNTLPFCIQGTQLSLTVYLDKEDSKVILNVDNNSVKYNPGNV